jgi:adenylylsulfate kinase
MDNKGFAIWLTGTPASGKSKRSRLLVEKLRSEGICIQRLESDELRKVLTPDPTYSMEEREWFYSVLVYLGKMLTDNGVNVIFDATGNLQRYRHAARDQIEKFAEVYVHCPPDVCLGRDPKGFYKDAKEGKAPNLPGVGSPYEVPENPELTCVSGEEPPEESVDKIHAWMKNAGWL